MILLSFTVFAAAQKTVVPIMQFSIDEEATTSGWGSLLGGVENGKFLDAKTTFGKMKGTEKFSLFNFKTGAKGEFSLGAVEPGPGACPTNYFTDSEVDVAANFAVGANANWNILPRKWQSVNTEDANYKKAVADVLRVRGLAKIPVKLEQAVRVDLDGDGTEEVLLVAKHYVEDATLTPTIGTYSALMMRKTTGGKARNILVGGNFLTKKDDYFGGKYTIAGIADFNGDGKMEVLVSIFGYEEHSIEVFEIKAGKLIQIKALSYYCGA